MTDLAKFSANIKRFLSEHKALSISVSIASLLLVVSLTIFALYKVGAKRDRITLIIGVKCSVEGVEKKQWKQIIELFNKKTAGQYLIISFNFNSLSKEAKCLMTFFSLLRPNSFIKDKNLVIFQLTDKYYTLLNNDMQKGFFGYTYDNKRTLDDGSNNPNWGFTQGDDFKNAIKINGQITSPVNQSKHQKAKNGKLEIILPERTHLNKFHDFIFNCASHAKLVKLLGMEKSS